MPNDVKAMEMKACPFCGGPAYFVADDSHGGCGVGCKSGCNAEPYCDAPKGNPECAIAAWNTRPAMEGAWEGIESAPKDGTMVLLAYAEEGRRKATVRAGVFGGMAWPRWYSRLPTHWRPLPVPPSTIDGGKG
ncbi:MAG: DUF551 domain-containing protein [Pseudomonadota bacterium]